MGCRQNNGSSEKEKKKMHLSSSSPARLYLSFSLAPAWRSRYERQQHRVACAYNARIFTRSARILLASVPFPIKKKKASKSTFCRTAHRSMARHQWRLATSRGAHMAARWRTGHRERAGICCCAWRHCGNEDISGAVASSWLSSSNPLAVCAYPPWVLLDQTWDARREVRHTVRA